MHSEIDKKKCDMGYVPKSTACMRRRKRVIEVLVNIETQLFIYIIQCIDPATELSELVMSARAALAVSGGCLALAALYRLWTKSGRLERQLAQAQVLALFVLRTCRICSCMVLACGVADGRATV